MYSTTMRSALITILTISGSATAQQIWDIWQTTWNRSPLFQYNPSSMGSLPINFNTPGKAASADIIVDDSTVYQKIWGFGASLTDSSALLMSQMKTKNSGNYWQMLDSLFDITDGANSAGFSYLRVPLGASDFSAKAYSYDDTSGDTSLNNFNINAAPSYLFSTIQDILTVNPSIKIHLLPWSPPGWMKSSSTMDGGSLKTADETIFANYLLKCLQGFKNQGITAYAIGIQNEPENSDTTYPSTSMPVSVEAAIGLTLRTLMNNNGFSSTKIIGYEHNWDDAAAYPVTLMQTAASAFDGVAFHCYAGSVSEQVLFTSKYPNKEVYFTECSGTLGSDWWSDIKWYMDNLFIGSLSYGSSTGLMWNLALNSSGLPKLPGTDSCSGSGCRGVVQINSDGTYSFNQEYYAMAQAAKAIIPKDSGGPWGQRIGVTVNGTLSWALVVGAYVTTRTSSSEWSRYSLVVLNWDDNSSTSWNPVAVNTTIEFRGKQAVITFPVGVTTLWWYAAPSSSLVEDVNLAFEDEESKEITGEETGDYAYSLPNDQKPFESDATTTATDNSGPEFDLGTIYGEMKDGKQMPLGLWH